MDMPKLQFDYLRRYGVEIEVNAFDGKDHIAPDKMPEGIYTVGNIVSSAIFDKVDVKFWRESLEHWDKHKPGNWLVKPDGSCGMEVCSPISKGWNGLNMICLVIDALASNQIKADNRCSLHIHVEVNDLTVYELANVITYWIKCEPVFFDAFPEIRKNNKYCEFIGWTDWVQADTDVSAEEIVRFFGNQKYTSINTFHYNKGRPTIEIRIADSVFCTNSYFTKNWIKLVIHFIEMARKMPTPTKYVPGDPWSSFLWLDPPAVFKLLGWDGNYELSEGMKQTRNWFLARMIENLGRSNVPILSLAGRRVAHAAVFDIIKKLMNKNEFDPREAIAPKNIHDAVYDKIYRA